MKSVVVVEPYEIVRQLNDSGEIVFIVTDKINLAAYNVELNVLSYRKVKYKFEAENVSKDGQKITITIPKNFLKKQENLTWELNLYNDNEEITAASGGFKIV